MFKTAFFRALFRIFFVFILGVIYLRQTAQLSYAAYPSSGSYKMLDYQIGGGGTAKSTSATYWISGSVGQIESLNPNSASYKSGNGLEFLGMANQPTPPTITNPTSSYNKLFVVINDGSNPTDTKFAIAVSPDAFASTTKYVQADDTLGVSAVWQTKAIWGGSGFNVIGLSPGVTYTMKTTAMQGNFSQSPFSVTAALATSNPTFSLGISPNSVGIGTLSPGTVVTSGTTVTSTISTNGGSGGTIYVYDTNSGLLSNSTSYTISAVSNDLSAISEGYGLRGTTTGQTSGGPMEIITPYNLAGSNVGVIDTTKRPIFDTSGASVVVGTATFEVKAKASNTAKAATDYADTLRIIGSATF